MRRHRNGGRQGAPSRLSPEQRQALVAQAATGAFATVKEAVAWTEQQFGARYTEAGMDSLFRRLHLKRKVPRPLAGQACLAAQAAWKKRASRRRSAAVGLSAPSAARVAWSDELRLGLHGQVRRRWAPRGIKLRQVVEVKYEWRYLAPAVTALGRLRWRWLANLKKEGLAEAVAAWQVDGVRALVWDNAPAHRARLVRSVGPPLVPLPAYSPELNPAERIFEELRRRAEGHVWGTIDAKVAEVEAFLQDVAQHPDRVRRLAGWTWITEALRQLPPQPFPATL